jgi:zinc and cadmium transporter
MNAVFALMVPLGAAVYVVVRGVVQAPAFTSFALAASAGTFLHLAFSDILPDLHRRGGSKLKLSASLLAGVAAMWALRLVNHSHG